MELADIEQGGGIAKGVTQQFANQFLVAHAISFHHIPVEHEGAVICQDQRPQCFIRKDNFRKSSPQQVAFQLMTDETLIVRIVSDNFQSSKGKALPEAQGEYFQGNAAAPQGGGQIPGEEARR